MSPPGSGGMNETPMRFALIAATLALPGLAVAGPKAKAAGTAPKSPPACGVKVLPLVEGNTWTYENTAAPTPPEDAIKRILATGKAPGILTADETLARRYLELGCLFTAVGSDQGILVGGSQQLARKFKQGTAGQG